MGGEEASQEARYLTDVLPKEYMHHLNADKMKHEQDLRSQSVLTQMR